MFNITKSFLSGMIGTDGLSSTGTLASCALKKYGYAANYVAPIVGGTEKRSPVMPRSMGTCGLNSFSSLAKNARAKYGYNGNFVMPIVGATEKLNSVRADKELRDEEILKKLLYPHECKDIADLYTIFNEMFSSAAKMKKAQAA